MARYALVTPGIVDGDAVSTDVLGMRAALKSLGHTVEVFAQKWNVRGTPPQDIRSIDRYITTSECVTILHFSVGWRAGFDAIRRLPGRKILKYHNITPAHFFQGISDEYVDSCQQGRDELSEMARWHFDQFQADSQFNLDELREFGAAPESGVVVPPFHQVDQLQETIADPDVLHAHADDLTNILMVGRVVPNKGHMQTIEMFARYAREYDNRSRLIFVGSIDPRLDVYNRQLQKRVSALGLRNQVIFTGKVTAAALKAHYDSAHVFLMASEHEGFCVPVVEAMANRVPIIALARTAVGETVGDGGLVWEEADPGLFAESISWIVHCRETRSRLGQSGHRRYCDRFKNQNIHRQFEAALSCL